MTDDLKHIVQKPWTKVYFSPQIKVLDISKIALMASSLFFQEHTRIFSNLKRPHLFNKLKLKILFLLKSFRQTYE